MHADPLMPVLVTTALVILALAWVAERLGVASTVGYIVSGVLVGPHSLGLISDEKVLSSLGAIGVLFLLFFVGMEVSLPSLLSGWRISVLGTTAQVGASVACVWLIGHWLGWPPARIVLLGFVVSLSSTAVVLRILQDRSEIESPVGRDVLGVLIVQDLAIVPMLIVVGLLGGGEIEAGRLALQIVGGVAIIVLMVGLARRGVVHLPFATFVGRSQETQVFAALLLCMGFAYLTDALGLSTALGAFLAGILVSMTRETRWIHEALVPFRVVFVSVFFMSVGMMIDLTFVSERWLTVALLVLTAFLTNTIVNMCVFRASGRSWHASLYGGALLSQIGELSFLLAAIGLQIGIISEFAHKTTVAVISLTLLLSPAWVWIVRRSTRRTESNGFEA